MAFTNQHGAHVPGRPNAWFALTPEQQAAARRQRRANRQDAVAHGSTPMLTGLSARNLGAADQASRNPTFLDALADPDDRYSSELTTFLSRRGIHR